jgi:hypothetical protein
MPALQERTFGKTGEEKAFFAKPEFDFQRTKPTESVRREGRDPRLRMGDGMVENKVGRMVTGFLRSQV